MGFSSAVSSVISKTFEWKGRASRSEYWFWSLFLFVCFFAVGVNAGLSVDTQNLTTQADKMAVAQAAAKSSGLMVGLILLFFLPTLAVTIRRLHDTGRSGWWYLVSLIPIIGLILISALALFPSQLGTNRWGDREEANNDAPWSGSQNTYGEDSAFETVPSVDSAIAQQKRKMAQAGSVVKKAVSAPVRMGQGAAPVFGKR